MKEKVLVLGASENPSRYTYKAILKLRENACTLVQLSLVFLKLLG